MVRKYARTGVTWGIRTHEPASPAETLHPPGDHIHTHTRTWCCVWACYDQEEGDSTAPYYVLGLRACAIVHHNKWSTLTAVMLLLCLATVIINDLTT